MTPAEVCDAVFGEYTRDTPLPKNVYCVQTGLSHPWDWFFNTPKPDWFVNPTEPVNMYGPYWGPYYA